MAETEDAKRRTVGRRNVDHVRQKGTWLLVIGVLLQGGFLTMSWRLLAIGERQLDRDRELLVAQHAELVREVQELRRDFGGRVSALEGRAVELAEGAATIRGVVMQRYRCPEIPPCPRCPKCPEPPSGPVIVTSPASVMPPLAAPPAPPQEKPKPPQMPGGDAWWRKRGR